MTRNVKRIAQGGFSLIELMVSLVLGMLVVGAAIGIFASNKQTYRATQGLGRIQENGQIAFELLSRDIREAGSNPCDVALPAGNIISGAGAATPDGANWYMALAYPLYGFESGASGAPAHVAGTDVIQVLRAGDDVRGLTADLVSGGNTATFAPGTPQFKSGDVVMICDMRVLGVFKANNDSTGTTTGTINFGNGFNDCNYFPQPNAGACAGASTAYLFPKFSSITALHGIRWFVRDSDGDATNGYSLYRQVNGGNAEEVIQGVTDLQLKYLTDTGYLDSSALATADAWKSVRAVRLTLTLRDTEVKGTDGQPLSRVIENVITLRNRVL
ncbi:prepilin-type N-terminal cleavage/methylation domain-containing protein [Pseudoxanthomonas suwonensis]|uniref:prepilin-type N-terminal cleavage/methylation domain-containing protein n=1 Tax=Pseudoxanthomonas suwonensis TaxID=314722 RepID=UPI000466BFB3|nr:prepilin-type N-terminal cleavage/methylation domain-containing protein [Pseudoxanthomonas suwonensis]